MQLNLNKLTVIYIKYFVILDNLIIRLFDVINNLITQNYIKLLGARDMP